MDTQPKDDVRTDDDQRHPVDSSRRVYNPRQVFVPRETRTSKGTLVFRTTDNDVYCRLVDGSIRRANPKVNGKVARKARAKLRRMTQA